MKNIIEQFKQISLFQAIPEKYLTELYSLSEERVLKKGDYLFHEGDHSCEFFWIIQGEVEILKKDAESQIEHQLSVLEEGNTIGELTIIDREPRSASVRALTDVKVLCIPFHIIEKLSETHQEMKDFYQTIYKSISNRLRVTNEKTVKALQVSLAETKLRLQMGNFMIYTLGTLCFFIFVVDGLQYLVQNVPSGTYITIPFLILFSVILLFGIKFVGLPFKSFGITFANWKKSSLKAIVYSLPLMVLAVIFKWFQITLIPEYSGRSLFEPFSLINATGLPLYLIWANTLLFYALFVAPVEEFMIRGVLQSCLEFFLLGKHKVLLAILVSNLLFSSLHIYLSPSIAFIAFFTGLFFGWLYSINKNLLAVSISHALLGIWAFWIVGIIL